MSKKCCIRVSALHSACLLPGAAANAQAQTASGSDANATDGGARASGDAEARNAPKLDRGRCGG